MTARRKSSGSVRGQGEPIAERRPVSHRHRRSGGRRRQRSPWRRPPRCRSGVPSLWLNVCWKCCSRSTSPRFMSSVIWAARVAELRWCPNAGWSSGRPSGARRLRVPPRRRIGSTRTGLAAAGWGRAGERFVGVRLLEKFLNFGQQRIGLLRCRRAGPAAGGAFRVCLGHGRAAWCADAPAWGLPLALAIQDLIDRVDRRT